MTFEAYIHFTSEANIQIDCKHAESNKIRTFLEGNKVFYPLWGYLAVMSILTFRGEMASIDRQSLKALTLQARVLGHI